MRGLTDGPLARRSRRLLLAGGVLAALVLPGVAPAVAGAHAGQRASTGHSSHQGHHERTHRIFGHKVG